MHAVLEARRAAPAILYLPHLQVPHADCALQILGEACMQRSAGFR